MPSCQNCNGAEFYLHEGLYYCVECNTQTQELREEDEEDEYQENVIKRLSIYTPRAEVKESKSHGGIVWITNEAFNIVIHKQVKTLIQLGASPKFKDIVLQLWATYLKKCEIAFMEKEVSGDWTPKLGATPRPRDMKILSGKKRLNFSQSLRKTAVIGGKRVPLHKDKSCKRTKNKALLKKKKHSGDVHSDFRNFMIGLLPSENQEGTLFTPKRKPAYKLYSSYARYVKHKSRKLGCSMPSKSADHMTLIKTVCFCYLGLLIVQDQIMLCDIIRWIKDGNFPYMDASHHLPDEMKLIGNEWRLLTPLLPPSVEKIISETTKLALFLGISSVPPRPLSSIITRFVIDLNLPFEIIPTAHALIQKVTTFAQYNKITKVESLPNYEACAIALLLVALKISIGLDDRTERQFDAFGRKLKCAFPGLELFLWDEWKEHTNLKIKFLKSRHVLFSSWSETLDVNCLCSFYHNTVSKWHPKEVQIKNRCKRAYNQKSFRNSLKNIFSDLQSESCSELPQCHLSTYPLWAATCYYVKQAQYSQQYKKETSIKSMLRDFSSSTLLYITQPTNFQKILKKKLGDENWAILNGSKFSFELDFMQKDTCTDEESQADDTAEVKHPDKVKYWFLHFKTCDTVYHRDELPSSFRWLLEICSDLISVSPDSLYNVIMHTERAIWKINHL